LARKKTTESAARPVFSPISGEQEQAYELCRRSTITFLTGPAGTSKSYTAMALAIDMLLESDGGITKIVLTRPAVEACGEELGYIPGTAAQKMGPYIHPLTDILKEYAPGNEDLIRSSLEIVPLAHMRGRTLRHCVAILDEAQNCNEEQLKMFLTRIGEGSKMIICGDPFQSDIRHSPLASLATDLKAIRGISHFEFSEQACKARHHIIIPILEMFKARHHGRQSSMQG
jgi:phosphate starvation-inducible PhoH-like protein